MKRTAERMYGMVLLVRLLTVGCVALLLLSAAGWMSWQYTRDDVLKGRQHGRLTVASCNGTTCHGSFSPGGQPVTIGQSALSDRQAQPGAQVDVVLRPAGDTVDGSNALRSGTAGIVHGLLPLGGALLLCGAMVGGILRFRRTAVTLGVTGAAIVVAAFVCAQ